MNMMLQKIDVALLAKLSVYSVLAYVLNVMFFFPFGDEYIKATMAVASIICLAYRKEKNIWSIGPAKFLFFPMLAYTGVLILSYIINDGFLSTINMYLISVLFVYCASVVRINASSISVLCIIAAIEMIVLMTKGIGQAQWGGRLGGYTNPIFLGMFTCVATVLSVYLVFFSENKIKKFSLWLSALAFLSATFMTQSRGVAIAYIPLTILLAFLLYRKGDIQLRLGLVVFVMLGFFLVWSAMSQSLIKRFYETENEFNLLLNQPKQEKTYLTSTGFRVLLWEFSWAVARENPIFGVGNSRFQQYKKDWSENGRFPMILSEYQPTTHAHNQYLQDLAMRGGVGLLSLLAMLLTPALKSVKMLKSDVVNQYYAGGMLLSLMIAFSIFSLTEVALKHPEKIALFTILSFIALMLSNKMPSPDE
jgi:O-antigen ligase